MMHLGVDYSINSPGICVGGVYHLFVHPNPEFAIKQTIETDKVTHVIQGVYYDGAALGHSYSGRAITMIKLILIELEKLKIEEPGTAFVEGYAFSKFGGGSGRLIQMAENVGVAKAFLLLKGYNIEEIQPTSVKKMAGKGNYDKKQMAQAFEKEYGYFPHEKIGCGIESSPASDIVDAHYLWKFGK